MGVVHMFVGLAYIFVDSVPSFMGVVHVIVSLFFCMWCAFFDVLHICCECHVYVYGFGLYHM